jgi:hypothetical protein
MAQNTDVSNIYTVHLKYISMFFMFNKTERNTIWGEYLGARESGGRLEKINWRAS